MESFPIKRLTFISILFVSFLLLVKCASQIPPSGGDVDNTPPEIEYLYPPNGTTNYSDDYFEITFSEYVHKRSVKGAVFISPRLENGVEFDWSGRTLTVYFRDTLKENTTYNVAVGTDVKDINNNNNMARSFNFAFSTGNKIDKGIVEGKVYDDNPEGILIFAYKKEGDDYPDPTEEQPSNITQAGKDGIYKLLGLSSGNYRVIAVRDDFKDFIYNVEDDQYAAPSKEIILTDSINQVSNFNFRMSREDTTGAHVYNITMTDSYHIMTEFSDYVDSLKLSASNFSIHDSTQNRSIAVKYLYKGEGKPKNYFLVAGDSLNIENENYLIVKSLADNYGNVVAVEATKFTASDRPDTSAPNLVKKNTEYLNSTVDFENAYIEFIFNDAFDFEEIKDAVKIYDLKENEIPSHLTKIDDSSFRVESDIKLTDKSDYKVNIDLSKFKDAAGNFTDSIYTYNFSTINALQFSGASGNVVSTHPSSLIHVVLKNIDRKKSDYSTRIDSAGTFKFSRVVPGKYLVWSFFDADSNNRYTYGKINPFEYSEEFVFYPDTLNLKARWPVGDIRINY